MTMLGVAPRKRLSRPDQRLEYFQRQLETATDAALRELLHRKIIGVERELSVPFTVTSRDQEMLRFIAHNPYATAVQVARHVGGSARNVANRMKLMFRFRLLDRPQLQYALLVNSNASITYTLGPAGAELLAGLGEEVDASLDWNAKNATLKPLTLAHELSVTEAVLAFNLACRAGSLTFVDQHELPIPNPFQANVTVKAPHVAHTVDLTTVPDRVFRIVRDDGTHNNYLLERDRASEIIGNKKTPLVGKSSFIKKQYGYFHFWKQGLHVERWGFKRWRVLTITSSDARIASMLKAQRIVTNTAHGLFLYTTQQRIDQHGVLGPAWVTAERDGVSLLDTGRQS
jgi:hypothetical protein